MKELGIFVLILIGVWIIWLVAIKQEGLEDTSGKFLSIPERGELEVKDAKWEDLKPSTNR